METTESPCPICGCYQVWEHNNECDGCGLDR